MNIPKDPKERFQYYFDITTGLDEKYQKVIDKISTEQFDYDPEKTYAYKKAVKGNAEAAEYDKKRNIGEFAKLSEGYDNSMQNVAENYINANKQRADREAYKGLYEAKHREWLEEKQRRIESAKKRYAKAYGNAYYNMLKANEEITFSSAK